MSTKVFVGNLAFRTTDQALQEAFAKHGKVKAGVIITRGRRSLGYGFVEFFSHEDASASVEHMNKTDLFGRQIKVELAKDPADRSTIPVEGDRERERGGEPGPARRRRRAPRSENASKSSDREVREADGERPAPRRNKRPARKAPTAGTHATTDREARIPQSRAPREPREPRAPREPRPKQPPREKVPSKTTLFVANLPFSVDDEQLRAIFADTKVKAAHVVRTRTNRSRGYGFVEFENEADQQAALASTNGKSVDSGPEKAARVISVSISNSVTSTVPPPAAAATPEPSTNQ